MLTEHSECVPIDQCVSVGVSAAGDVDVVYSELQTGYQDILFTRSDAVAGAWQTPRVLASNVNRYAPIWQHSTDVSGRSIVAIAVGSAFEVGHLVFRCLRSGMCGTPVSMRRPNAGQRSDH